MVSLSIPPSRVLRFHAVLLLGLLLGACHGGGRGNHAKEQVIWDKGGDDNRNNNVPAQVPVPFVVVPQEEAPKPSPAFPPSVSSEKKNENIPVVIGSRRNLYGEYSGPGVDVWTGGGSGTICTPSGCNTLPTGPSPSYSSPVAYPPTTPPEQTAEIQAEASTSSLLASSLSSCTRFVVENACNDLETSYVQGSYEVVSDIETVSRLMSCPSPRQTDDTPIFYNQDGRSVLYYKKNPYDYWMFTSLTSFCTDDGGWAWFDGNPSNPLIDTATTVRCYHTDSETNITSLIDTGITLTCNEKKDRAVSNGAIVGIVLALIILATFCMWRVSKKNVKDEDNKQKNEEADVGGKKFNIDNANAVTEGNDNGKETDFEEGNEPTTTSHSEDHSDDVATATPPSMQISQSPVNTAAASTSSMTAALSSMFQDPESTTATDDTGKDAMIKEVAVTKASKNEKLGIGLKCDENSGLFRIHSIANGSPFQSTDLVVGVKVTKINGVTIKGQEMSFCLNLLKNIVGTVTLEIAFDDLMAQDRDVAHV